MALQKSAVRALAVTLGVVAVFVFSRGVAHAAFQACACRCIDTATIEKRYVAPQPGQDCRASCIAAENGCSAEKLQRASTVSVRGSNQCECQCSAPTTRMEFTAMTSGRSSCAGDCAQACGGAAFVDPSQSQTANHHSVDCLRDDQCAVGVFGVYAQRNTCDPSDPTCGAPRCEYEALEEGAAGRATWADFGYFRPRCVIPATALNADIECQNYGGAAKGGVCRRFDEGENLAQYTITRPFVSNGTYQTWDINTTNPPLTVSRLNSNLNNDTSHRPSLCELYGETQDVVIGSQTPNTNPNAEKYVGITFTFTGVSQVPQNAQPLSISASKRYVCAVKKINTCGTVKPTLTEGLTIQTANAYSCVDPIRVGIPQGQTGTACFNATSRPELCVNSPGTLCCAEAAAGCYSDADCIAPKRCMKENEDDQFGDCEYVTICDDRNEARRCRSATLTERENSSICSPEVVPGTSRCGTGTQACCGASLPQVNSACALDLFGQARVGESTSYYTQVDLVPFMCLKMSAVKSAGAQWRQNGNDTELIPFREGGACLTNNDPSFANGKRVTRCGGADELCCNTYALGAQSLIDAQNERLTHTNGQDCLPDEEGFSCRSLPSIPASALNAHGFQDQRSYLSALAASPYCAMASIDGSSYANTRQCAPNFICCQTGLALANEFWCTDDAACAGRGGGDLVCDLSIKKCVSRNLAEERSKETCVDLARSEGEADVDAVVPEGEEGTFSCQLVADADAGQVRTLCLQRGCRAENTTGKTLEGSSYRCCAPGVGSSGATAANQGMAPGTGATVKAAPGSIQWLPCMAAGNCSLDEIVANGAAFANFLITISGAVYLAIFVYAGFRYLTAGSSNRVEKAKEMLRQATIGLVLLLSAFVFIRFIQQTFIGNALNAPKSATTCGETDATKDFSCRYLSVDPADSKALKSAITTNGCFQGLCPSDKAPNYVCCPVR